IITALSRIRWLFVIARNSSFTYKGQAIDVKRIGRELGVCYVLEGSVRKGGGRVRITAQLIEGERTGAGRGASRRVRGAAHGASAGFGASRRPASDRRGNPRADGAGRNRCFRDIAWRGNGLLTIAKGTVPLAIFGLVGYGLRTGLLGAPARATQAAS